MENITEIEKDVWGHVHSLFGHSIYMEIQRMEKQDQIELKMESMHDSLIDKINEDLNKDIDPMDIRDYKRFLEEYNTNPDVYKKVIIEEYTREYNNKFNQ